MHSLINPTSSPPP